MREMTMAMSWVVHVRHARVEDDAIDVSWEEGDESLDEANTGSRERYVRPRDVARRYASAGLACKSRPYVTRPIARTIV